MVVVASGMHVNIFHFVLENKQTGQPSFHVRLLVLRRVCAARHVSEGRRFGQGLWGVHMKPSVIFSTLALPAHSRGFLKPLGIHSFAVEAMSSSLRWSTRLRLASEGVQ